MRIAAVVVEKLPRLMRHRTVENELGPIGASFQIPDGLLLAALESLIPVKPRGHVQKVLNRDGLLFVVDIGDVAIGEKIQHRMIETVELAVLVDHADQSADDCFGARMNVVRKSRRVGRVSSLSHNPPVTHDEQTVKAMASPKVDERSELRRIHALLFRRRRQPFLGRPRRLIQVLRAHGRQGNGGQQSA
jgi:hypothetical protein